MYYVVLQDGQKFGPADLPTLNQWVAEGRILVNTTLEDAQTGQRLYASQLPGIQLATAQPTSAYPAPGTMNPPQPYAAYTRPGQGTNADSGQSDLNAAYIFAIIGFVFCPLGVFFSCPLLSLLFPILGLVYAHRAETKGNQGSMTVKVLCWVALVIQFVGMLAGGAACGMGMFG